jgi:hypothetical protein
MTLLATGLAFLGCILLSVSLKRHYLQTWPDSGAYERWLLPNRVAGYTCLFLSLVPCVLFRGFWIGLVLWSSIVALAAFAQAMLLTWRPRYSMVYGGAGVLMILGGRLA